MILDGIEEDVALEAGEQFVYWLVCRLVKRHDTLATGIFPLRWREINYMASAKVPFLDKYSLHEMVNRERISPPRQVIVTQQVYCSASMHSFYK